MSVNTLLEFSHGDLLPKGLFPLREVMHGAVPADGGQQVTVDPKRPKMLL